MTVIQAIDSRGCGCDAPEQVKSLISIDAAISRIREHTCPVDRTESLALEHACGRILAEPILSHAMTPPFDNSAMDGYAISCAALADDGPWSLTVTGRISAGDSADTFAVDVGAVRIFTGAPIPDGADAVIMQEDVTRDAQTIRFTRMPKPGQNIRGAGEDMLEGAEILAAGQRLGPREIAACAAAGHGQVRVRRKIRVALLVTGDEIRQTGDALTGGTIWDINTPLMRAQLNRPDVDLVAVHHARDSRDDVRHQIAALADNCDLLITTGGVSVGEEDHVKPALTQLNMTFVFSGVALKPGKPVSFGQLGACNWLGLPGNPLSAYVTWHLFGTVIVQALTGGTAGRDARRHVVLHQDIRRLPGRCELRLARVTGFDGLGREVVDLDNATHSGRVAGLPAADGMLLLPADQDYLPSGALVEFQLFCDM